MLANCSTLRQFLPPSSVHPPRAPGPSRRLIAPSGLIAASLRIRSAPSHRLRFVAFDRRSSARFAWPDALAFAGTEIETGDVALLRGRVHDVGIIGIVARLES